MKKILVLLMMLSLLLMVVSCDLGIEDIPVTDSKSAATVEETATTTTVATASSNQIVIENDQFMPTTLEITAGTTVEWVNKDSVDHTVTFENGDVDQKLVVGATTTYIFTETGEYRYFCQLHPGMQGNVIIG